MIDRTLPRSAFDDDALLTLLRSPARDLVGCRFVHFHLSKLSDESAADPTAVSRALNDMSAPASVWRVFILANGDVAAVYRGLPWSLVDQTCREIATGMLARTRMAEKNPYTSDAALYSILDISFCSPQIVAQLGQTAPLSMPTVH